MKINEPNLSEGGLFLLKMQDKGLTKEEIASAALITTPINMLKTVIIAPLVRKKPLYMFFYCGAAYFCINILSGTVLFFFDDLRESGKLYAAYLVTRNVWNFL